ncbi:MAG: hypothetical protein EBU00_00240 [Alphaproteobacteria bacterium]|nr:hypothetical protein [Alphaproteobacteria bacterium]
MTETPPPQDTPQRDEDLNVAPSDKSVLSSGRVKRHWSFHLSMRGIGLVAEIVGLFLVVIGLVAGFGLWTLSSGPIKSEFITRQIASGIESRLPQGYAVSLSGAEISEVVGGLHLHIDGFVIRDETGKSVIVAPRAEIGFDGLSLLLGRLVPRDIELSGLLVAVTIKPDGTVAISEDLIEATESNDVPNQTTTPEMDAQNAAPLAMGAFIDALSLKQGPLGILEKATLRNGILRIDDQRRGRSLRYRNLSLVFERVTDQQIELDIGADSDNGPWRVEASLKGKAGETRQLNLKTSDVRVSELLGFAERGTIPLRTDMPLSLEFSAEVDGKSELTALKGAIKGGRATIILDDPRAPPIRVDEVKGEFALSDDGTRIIIPLIEFASAATHWRISGEVRLPHLADDGWDFVLRSGGATLMTDLSGRPPVSIDRFSLNGTVTAGFRATRIDAIEIMGPDLALTGNALLGAADGRDGLRLFLKAEKSSALNLLAFWPSFLVPEVRAYLGQAIEGGMMTEAKYALDLDPESFAAAAAGKAIPDKSVALEIAFQNGTIRVDKGLPRFINTKGRVYASGKKVSVEMDAGQIELPEGRSLAITSGTYKVPNTDIVPAPLKPQDINVSADGVFQNLHMDRAFGSEPLDNGTVRVKVNGQGLLINGEGLLGGAASQFELRQAKDATVQDATVSMIIDDAVREKKQMRTQNLLNGPVTLNLKLTGIGSPKIRGTGDLDLQKASVSGLIPGWTRPTGKPGKATFNFTLMPDQSIKLGDLTFDDPSAAFRGSAEISPDGELKAVTFSQLRINAGDKVAASLERLQQGYRVKIQGDTLDGRALIKTITSPGKNSATSGQDIDLDLKVGTLSGFNSEVMRNADIRIQTKNGGLKDLRIDGKLAQQSVIAQQARGENGQPVFVIQSADAGALLRFTDLYKRMNTGALSLQIAATGEPLEGTLTIRRFAILDEEVLAQLNAQPGAPGGKPIITDPRNVQFNRLAASFTLGSGRITIKDGVISGPVIGASIEGTIDYSKNGIDLRGAIVPAYIVNNLFNKLPIIGQLLGGENEGIFSINYRAVGQLSSPSISYNPLSVVAPGFLRKLFEDRTPSEGVKPPSDVPKQP